MWNLFDGGDAEKFRFSAEFIEMRRQGLDIFVNRIASHQELQQSEDLRTFLQADEEVGEILSFTVYPVAFSWCWLWEFMDMLNWNYYLFLYYLSLVFLLTQVSIIHPILWNNWVTSYKGMSMYAPKLSIM